MAVSIMDLDSTIVAISTPPGRGGIGIIRISGAEALPLALSLFRFGEERLVRSANKIKPSLAYRGWVVDRQDNDKLVDDGLLLYFKAPNSFTGEEVVELQLHGSPRGLERVLGMLVGSGARHALPLRLALAGEFSRRALIHGRIDLAQAEAIIDIIDAKTARSAELAAQQLLGLLGKKVHETRVVLLGWFAHLEALLDFPEDQVPEIDEVTFDEAIRSTADELARILKQSEHAWIYREGLRVAIVGPPNMGKSSLFNRLLQRDRAIVSAISGTTRDVIEEAVDIEGVPVIFSDTAGITASEDVLEKMGIERSVAAIEAAELLLIVLDASDERSTLESFLGSLEPSVRSLILGKRQIVVWNKSENSVEGYRVKASLSERSLPAGEAGFDKLRMTEGGAGITGVVPDDMVISVKEDKGIDVLQQAIVAAYKLDGSENEELIVTNLRQRQALEGAASALAKVQENRQLGLGWDVVAYELREATEQLGLVTGANMDSELHDQIFGRFCIGK